MASQTGGIFILRIEDTDQARLVPGAVEDIINSLTWLDTRPDEGPGIGGNYGPYVQSERLDLYQGAAQWLVEQGHAYHCFCSVERLDEVRQQQTARGEKPMYDGHCGALDPQEVKARLAAGEKNVIRMRIPRGRELPFHDVVRGTITFDSNEIDESVIIKSDGFPTYHLAAVVDDHFMRITTIVRGEEWITSTPKHVLLYNYFNWNLPRFLHTPLLRDAEKRKLSKRSGDTSVAFFASQGILPGGFRNFLTRIIWPHPEGKDIYDFAEFVRMFKPDQLPKTGPVVDYVLLTFINSHYLWQLSPEQLYDAIIALLDEHIAAGEGFRDLLHDEADGGFVPAEQLVVLRDALQADREKSLVILKLGAERFKRVTDIIRQVQFYFAGLFTPASGQTIAAAAGSPAAAQQFIPAYRQQFRSFTSKETWEHFVRDEAKKMGLKPGKLFMLLRIAITGSDKTPPLHDILDILGNDEVDRRLILAGDAVAQL